MSVGIRNANRRMTAVYPATSVIKVASFRTNLGEDPARFGRSRQECGTTVQLDGAIEPSHGRVGVVQHQSLRSSHEELNISSENILSGVILSSQKRTTSSSRHLSSNKDSHS